MNAPSLTLGSWLREARIRSGFNQADTARVLNVSRPLVSRWEKGRSTPDIIQFAALVTLYEADWLYEIVRQRHPSTMHAA